MQKIFKKSKHVKKIKKSKTKLKKLKHFKKSKKSNNKKTKKIQIRLVFDQSSSVHPFQNPGGGGCPERFGGQMDGRTDDRRADGQKSSCLLLDF